MKINRIWLLALAVLAGMVVLNTIPAVAAKHEQTLKVGKNGDITLTKETMVGDMMLKPGRYKIQHRVEGEDHFIHFTEVTKANDLYGAGGGGVPKAHPGEVKCKLEPLSKKAEATAVYTDSEGGMNRVTKVEIAGENVAHLF